MRKLSQVLVSGVAVCLLSAPAWATHKSWNLVDPGANCRSSFSGTTAAQFRFTDGAIKNNGTSSAGVWCPVTLAGRYGSGTQFNMARWPTSRAATVYGFDASSTDDIRCNLIVMSDTGSIYSSSTKTVANANNSVVQISMVSNGSWGLEIGNGMTLSIRSAGYNCNVPPGSSIYAYEEKICQYTSSTPSGVCAGGDTTPSQTTDIPTSAVTQDNGFACLADASNPSGSMWRNGDGIQNTGSNPLNVYCPLSRTSSDSRTQQGSYAIDRLQVYSSGDVPTCKLTCRSQFTGSVTSSSNTFMGTAQWMDPTFPPQLPILGSWTPACAGALGASCSLPSLTTLQGFLHQDEIPPVDNGI